MTFYELLGWITAAIALGLGAGRMVNHLMHAHRQKEAIDRILWQEAADRARLTHDVTRMANALETIALHIEGLFL